MKYFLSIILVLCLASIADAKLFRQVTSYNMSPCVQYDFTPVQTTVKVVEKAAQTTKKVVETPVKVTTQVVRKLVGYRKVCGPNGCSLQPVYENVTVSVNAKDTKK